MLAASSTLSDDQVLYQLRPCAGEGLINVSEMPSVRRDLVLMVRSSAVGRRRNLRLHIARRLTMPIYVDQHMFLPFLSTTGVPLCALCCVHRTVAVLTVVGFTVQVLLQDFVENTTCFSPRSGSMYSDSTQRERSRACRRRADILVDE